MAINFDLPISPTLEALHFAARNFINWRRVKEIPSSSGNEIFLQARDNAVASLAVHRVLGSTWTPSGSGLPNVPDFGARGKVWGAHQIDAPLRVFEATHNSGLWVLVLVDPNLTRVSIVGWIRGGDAERPEWLESPAHPYYPVSYLVPQGDLEPPGTFPIEELE